MRLSSRRVTRWTPTGFGRSGRPRADQACLLAATALSKVAVTRSRSALTRMPVPFSDFRYSVASETAAEEPPKSGASSAGVR